MKKIFTSVMAMAFAMTMSAQTAVTASEAVAVKAECFNYDLIVEAPDAVKDLPSGIPDDHQCQRAAQVLLDNPILEIGGTGVPSDYATGFTTAAGHAYKFQAFDANNAIVIQSNEGGASAEIVFENPVSAANFNNLGIIADSHLGDSYPTADITLNYSDGTTEVVTRTIVDWCANPGGNYPAYIAAFDKRVRPTNDKALQAHVENNNNFFHEITVPFTKDLKSITVKNNVTSKHEWGWPTIVISAISAYKEVDNLYVIGDIATNGWTNGDNPAAPDAMTWNAETQAFEFAFTAKGDSYFAVSDVAEPTSWDDFNANHRYAIQAGNAEITLDQATQLVLVQGEGSIKVSGAGIYKVSIDKTLKMTVTKTADVDVTTAYYLVGNMTEWKATDAYKLTKNEAAEGEEYSITVDLAADAQFKIVAADEEKTITTWYPDNAGNYGANGEMQGAGTYTVYFRPNADGGDGWFNGVIYAVNTTGISNIAAETLKTAVIYNINGQRVSQPSRGLYIMNGKKVVLK